MPAGGDGGHPGEQLLLALGPALGTPVAHQPQLRLDVARHQPRVVTERDLPLGTLGHDAGPREGARTVGPQQAPGVVEVEVAHRDDVDGLGFEAGVPKGGDHPRPLVAAHGPGLLVQPVADAGLDEDPTRGRLDQAGN